MFTGIVQGLCEVVAVDDVTNLRRLSVDLGDLVEGLELGASVAVNGTCLTVAVIAETVTHFDVIRETLERTNLAGLVPGSRANVERSFRVGDEVGGHIVSGHVSGVATVNRVEESTNERNVFFGVPPDLVKYLPMKGFVALDGASLTIAHVDPQAGEIGVCLIPETIGRTTLGSATAGQAVNLEVDSQTQAIVDTVERLLGDAQWRARLGL